MFLDCIAAESKFIEDFNCCISGTGGRTISKDALKNLFQTKYKEFLDKPESQGVKEEINSKINGMGDQVNLKEFFDCVGLLYNKCPEFFKK
ncbi:unnamed protein product [Ophioblennius macclurei]